MVGTSRRRLLAQATPLLAGIGLGPQVSAQTTTFPSRPIRVLVGFAAGGGNDVIARLVAQKMSEGSSGQVLVDNKTGASGLIAADILAKAPPDGTTLMVAAQTTTSSPRNYTVGGLRRATRRRGCLPARRLTARAGGQSLVCRQIVGELVDMAKAKPGAINFGSGGVGTTPHMAAELFLFITGIRMTHVAYRGEAPVIADVLAGQLPLLFANVSVVTGQVKAGTLRALAVTSPTRAPGLPDVPTLAEAGIKGSDVETWFGLTAPAATPREIVQRLNAEVRRPSPAPTCSNARRAQPVGDAEHARELDALIKSEAVRWGEVIQRANIRAPE